MKFYHEVLGCSLAVDIVARELQIPLDLHWVDMKTKTLDDGSNYLDVNSKGTVPTLELPDGQHLSEGAVIMQYLADQDPSASLLDRPGTMGRLRVQEWMSFIAADLHKGGFMPLFKPGTPSDYRSISKDYVRGKLSWLNSQLERRDYLVNDRFSIADAHCYVIASWSHVHDIETTSWPSLESYLKRVGVRPSVREAERAATDRGARFGRATPFRLR